MPENNFEGVKFQKFPTDYYTWGRPIFVLESPLKGGSPGIPKWETRATTGVYLEHS